MAIPHYTTEQMIRAIRLSKGMVTKAAERLKCDPQTVRNYMRRYASVALVVQEERERMTDIAEMALYDAIKRGEGWATCFYLKTQGKDRGYVERHEITGKDGEALHIQLSWDDAGSEDQDFIDSTPILAPRPALGEAQSGAV